MHRAAGSGHTHFEPDDSNGGTPVVHHKKNVRSYMRVVRHEDHVARDSFELCGEQRWHSL